MGDAMDISRSADELRRSAEELRATAQRMSDMADALDAEAGTNQVHHLPPMRETAAPAVHPEQLLTLASKIYAGRRARTRFLRDDLLGEPAWDILLDLFIAEMRGRRLSTSSLCIAAAVPSPTALRWIRILEKCGLVHSESCSTDPRITWQSLTPKGSSAMRECLSGFVTELPAPIRRELRLVSA